MTAGMHAAGVRLTCDDCATTEVVGHGGELGGAVRSAVTGSGWTGSPYARGRHRCPRCGPGDNPPREPPTEMSIAITSPAAVVRVTGDIDLPAVPDLRRTLDNAVALHPYVIVDLTAARAVGPAGLGVLRRARAAARRRRGDLLLATAPDARRWTREFRTFATVPEAITAAVGRP
ncbi:hypothetical protein Aab01nite_01090 [Paractinoplanes abujensis]|uniref:Anti-anti-sigma factor n=1 Tax=Paractinoplanes abujensis TaxID=882441 RepID=A0A7W7G1F1_9ACTN|nr:STAS domain-containing protein [Actinoplanes abujensis]MBB4692065.1 anti-anti-sigma factor [Actinoplanes abujensis]GID16519.1 hypothetical protein Aab01nite_01090 [Actinoplanes abujensis]